MEIRLPVSEESCHKLHSDKKTLPTKWRTQWGVSGGLAHKGRDVREISLQTSLQRFGSRPCHPQRCG